MLNKYISGYFERLIAVILEWGGDIIKFAGDAMLVVWRNPRKASVALDQKLAARGQTAVGNKAAGHKNLLAVLGTGEETLATLVLRAVACNLSLIATLNNYSPTKGVTLAMHMGIGAGLLSGLFVGGTQNNW